jgi:hypothetical protein
MPDGNSVVLTRREYLIGFGIFFWLLISSLTWGFLINHFFSNANLRNEDASAITFIDSLKESAFVIGVTFANIFFMSMVFMNMGILIISVPTK